MKKLPAFAASWGIAAMVAILVVATAAATAAAATATVAANSQCYNDDGYAANLRTA